MTSPWTGHCHRCQKRTRIHTMSKFNVDLICPKCDDEERCHPDFPLAAKAEMDAVLRGDHHFPGIGWPGLSTVVRAPSFWEGIFSRSSSPEAE